MLLLGLQPYQFLVAVLSLAMIGFGIERFLYGGRGQTPLKLLIRLAVWGGMLLISLFPKVTYTIAGIIGIEGNINAVILIGFLLIFLIIFKILAVIERIEQQITSLTRKEALKNLKPAKKKIG